MTNNQWLMIAGAGLALAWYLKQQEALDPTSQNNVANVWFNNLYQGGPDGEGTLGTDVAEVNYEYSPYVLADKAREGIKSWWAGLW